MLDNLRTVPVFPTWRKFILDDLDWYKAFFRSVPCCADISPANIPTWINFNEDLFLSKINNSLIFKFSNLFDDNKITVFAIGNDLDGEALSVIFEFQKENNLMIGVFTLQELMPKLNHDKYIIEPQRDDHEYILDVKQQVKLEGSLFSRQRRRIGYFHRQQQDQEIQSHAINSCSAEFSSSINYALSNWGLMQNDSFPNAEETILKRIITLKDSLDLNMLAIKIGNQLCSVNIFSIHDDTAIIKHVKVDDSIQYLFAYSTYALACHLDILGISYMNMEQDLGIPGLRDHKLRLRPIRLLEKIKITPIS